VITRDDLLRALTGRRIAAWSICHRRARATIADHLGARRRELGSRWALAVHVDTPRGRGTATLDVSDRDVDVELLVDELVTRAAAHPGRPWLTPPTAAPARVDLVDADLGQAPLDDLAHGPLDDLARALAASPRPGALTIARAQLEDIAVETHGGLRVRWRAATLDAELTLRRGDHTLTLRRAARRRADLERDLAAALATADIDLDLAAAPTIGGPVPGRAALLLPIDAMLAGDPRGLGVWAALVAQADPEAERAGLTRLRRGAPLTPGAADLAAPLTVESDGARPFGLRAAPIHDDGAAVRRFPLVDAGRAADLGLTLRDAGLRDLAPNGGVRDLLVAPGAWTGDLPTTRTIELRRLTALDLAPHSGAATLVIDLAIDHDAGTRRPFRGGAIHLDRAARHTDLTTVGAYRGPIALLIDDVELSD
jgi:hypothetical protein